MLTNDLPVTHLEKKEKKEGNSNQKEEVKQQSNEEISKSSQSDKNLGNISVNKEDAKEKMEKEELKKQLNLDKPLKENESSKEFKEIEKVLEKKEFREAEVKDWKDLLLELEHIGKNLEELMLDVDRKLYYNLELKDKIDNIEKRLEDISLLIEETLLTGEKAVIYYLKKNKNKPIKLKELYKRFNRKTVNRVIEELYDKGFVKILK